MNAVSRIQVDEAARYPSTREFLKEILLCIDIQVNDSEQTAADHLFTYTRKSPPTGAATVVIAEEKTELGSGGDPSVQSYFSYLRFWKDNKACI